jgi:hypothetical protein
MLASEQWNAVIKHNDDPAQSDAAFISNRISDAARLRGGSIAGACPA